MYDKELIELLQSNTNITSIWFNDSKNWHTSQMGDFTKEVSREEILKPKKDNGVK